VSVPAPSDGNDDPWWYDRIAHQAHALAASGFTHLQLPPVHSTIGKDSPTSDGYGVYWEYDLGSDNRPTRFGTAERLQRMCAIAKANGLSLLADWVPHQRYGGRGGFYDYKSSSGAPGRFPKTPSCFLRTGGNPGGVPRDPIAGPVADDFAFGDELCPINALPKGYVLNGLIDAGDWLYRRLNLDGCRNDDTKGQAFEAVMKWANAKAMKGKTVIGEYAEGDRNTLRWWVEQTGLRCSTYDFEVKYRARDMCNNGSRWNMQQLTRAGLASFGWPYSMNAVTFIENADSDTNGFGSVVFNKLLGYAWILTSEGWPSIYYRDYATDKYCYGLKPHIDNLIWIHEHLANGPTVWRHAEYQFVVYERPGEPGLLVGLNNDVWGGWKNCWVPTSFPPGTRLHDYTGHSDDVTVGPTGWVQIWIPPNNNGKGYVCLSKAGYSKPNEVKKWATTQVFEGADDLDIAPAMPGRTLPVQRIWCAKESQVRMERKAGLDTLQFMLVDQGGATIGNDGADWLRTHDEGWYTILVTNNGMNAAPFQIAVTYTAPQEMR